MVASFIQSGFEIIVYGLTDMLIIPQRPSLTIGPSMKIKNEAASDATRHFHA